MNMDESARRWMYKYAWTNYWRISSWYDMDDLIQDGYMCWMIVMRRYTDAVDSAHVMSLFQRTFTNHIHSLSRTKTAQLDMPIADCIGADETEVTFIEHHSGSIDDLRGLAHAPQIIRDAIQAIMQKADKLRGPSRRYNDGRRQTTNDKLCALAGHDPNGVWSMIDLSAQIRHYLGG